MEKTSKQLKDEEVKARDEATRLESLNEKIQSKLESYQQLFDHNQRMIYLGNKVNDIAETYFTDKKKRPLISEFLKIVETENSKRKPKAPKEKKKEKIQKEQVAREMEKKVEVIREKKKEEKKQAVRQEQNKPKRSSRSATGYVFRMARLWAVSRL